jgi:hypothetical protein
MSAPHKISPLDALLRKRLFYHCIFWIAYYGLAAMITLSIHHIYEPRFYWQMLTLVPPDMLLVYFNIYILIPRFLFKRKFAAYTFCIVIAILLQSLVCVAVHRIYANTGTEAYSDAKNFDLRTIAVQVLNAIYLLGLTMGLKFVKDRMIHERAELDLLRTQIHPHFFFNTLNNLYSLSVQRSDQAPDLILKLSELMSYMLYDAAAPTVPLSKELETLDNYIAIESLRFGARLDCSFHKNITDPTIPIPPLLLLTFVENSFKHGRQSGPGPLHIDIDCTTTRKELGFRISNPTPPASSSSKPGIGLKNVRRRLDLLYQKKYSLDINRSDDNFLVTLKIPIP